MCPAEGDPGMGYGSGPGVYMAATKPRSPSTPRSSRRTPATLTELLQQTLTRPKTRTYGRAGGGRTPEGAGSELGLGLRRPVGGFGDSYCPPGGSRSPPNPAGDDPGPASGRDWARR